MRVVGWVLFGAGGFLLAIAGVVSYRYICRASNTELATEDAMPDHKEALQQFRGHYGRLCTLVAQALCREVDGAYVFDPDADESAVVEAALGRGHRGEPIYRELRRQRAALDKATDRCQDLCVPVGDFVSEASIIHMTIGDEWDMALPTFAYREVA